LRKLGAAGVWLRRDLNNGITHSQPRPNGKVVDGEIEVDIELITTKGPPITGGGNGIGGPGVHQGDLSLWVGSTVLHVRISPCLPIVTDEPFVKIQLTALDYLTLTVGRAANDHLKLSGAGWCGEYLVEEGLEFGSVAMHLLQYGWSVEWGPSALDRSSPSDW
jgi:hypothetical protein